MVSECGSTRLLKGPGAGSSFVLFWDGNHRKGDHWPEEDVVTVTVDCFSMSQGACLATYS